MYLRIIERWNCQDCFVLSSFLIMSMDEVFFSWVDNLQYSTNKLFSLLKNLIVQYNIMGQSKPTPKSLVNWL